MTYSHLDPVMQNRVAWNAGKTVGTKRPLTQIQIWAIRFFLDREERLRDRALFNLAIDSKLRVCDLVKLRIGVLIAGENIRTRAMVIQRKTGRPVQLEMTADARGSLTAWLQRRGGTADDYVFPSRLDRSRPISTRQYARLVDEWVTAIGLRREDYGTHSMRRTKAAMIYRATGNLRAVQILLGHTKIENTVRYLGVDVEDALMLAELTKIGPSMRLSGIARRPLAVDGMGLGIDGNWVVSRRRNFWGAAVDLNSKQSPVSLIRCQRNR